MKRLPQTWIFALGIVLSIALLPGFAVAQSGGGQTSIGGGGQTSSGQIGSTQTSSGLTGTTTGSSGLTGSSQSSGSSGSVSNANQPLNLQNQLNLGTFSTESLFTNDRIQPFVGPSNANIVHPRSQIASGSTSGAGGGAINLNSLLRQANRAGMLGTGATGTSQGFSIQRRGVRGALSYELSRAASQAITEVPSSFVSRITRTPAFDGVQGLNVNLENRVATVSGTVDSSDQKKLIERQLLMEPGVSRVVNTLNVRQ